MKTAMNIPSETQLAAFPGFFSIHRRPVPYPLGNRSYTFLPETEK